MVMLFGRKPLDTRFEACNSSFFNFFFSFFFQFFLHLLFLFVFFSTFLFCKKKSIYKWVWPTTPLYFFGDNPVTDIGHNILIGFVTGVSKTCE